MGYALCRRPLYFGFPFWLLRFEKICRNSCWFAGDLGSGRCQFWLAKRGIWHSCRVHWSTLGNHPAIHEDFGAQEAYISVEVGSISRPHFVSSLRRLQRTCVFLLCAFAGRSSLLLFRGLLLDVWDSRIEHLVQDVSPNTLLHRCWVSVDFGVMRKCF